MKRFSPRAVDTAIAAAVLGARRILATDVERAELAAALIRRAGSDALAEMDVLLGVLQAVPERHAQPTLDRLDELIAHTRAAGLAVTLDVKGVRRALPAGAEPALYRVVQKALTTRSSTPTEPPHTSSSPGAPTRSSCRSPTTATAARVPSSRAPVTASSECTSASACTAARSRPGRDPAASSGSAPGCRSSRA